MGVDRTGKSTASFAVSTESVQVASPPTLAATKEALNLPDLRRAPREAANPMAGAIAAPQATSRPDAANMKAEQSRIIANVHPGADSSVVGSFVSRVATALS